MATDQPLINPQTGEAFGETVNPFEEGSVVDPQTGAR